MFLDFVSKKSTSHRPSGISSESNKLLHVILYLSTFPKKLRARNFFLMNFSISLLQPSSYLRKLTNTLFFNWSLLGLVLKRLCYRQVPQVPHVGSHLTSSFVGFPTLEKRRRKDAPNLSSPSPNVRRDKISRSGEPLTLILYQSINIANLYSLFEGVCLTHVILTPGACGRGVPTCG